MTKKLRYFCTLLLMAVAGVAWGQDLTAKNTVDELVTANNWTVSQQNSEVCYTRFSLDDNVTISTTGEPNCGSVWGNSDRDWRLYQGQGGDVVISVAEGYVLKSVKLTFTNKNSGILKYGDGTITSGAATKVSGNSVTFTVGSSGTDTKGQIRITAFEVTYASSDSPVLKDCDLALTGSTNLVFDLYDNKEPQVINYTTSSTGDVSVVESDYATFAVDKENKKITVTPTKVTSGEQTIVVNQAADSNYDIGSTSFKLTITDSTPFESGDMTFDATKDKGNTTAGSGSIVKDPVTFACTNGILGNGSEYRIYKDAEATISSSAGNITKIVFTVASGYSASNLSTNTGSFSDGTWTGEAKSVKFTASSQVRVKKIVVTVAPETTDPAINADNVSLGYDETSGAIAYTIDNAVAGEVLSAEVTDGDWLTLGTVAEESVPFTCTENTAYEARTATVKLTYASATKDITVTQAAAPVYYDNIAAMFDAATSTETAVLVKFGGWVVTGVNGSNAYVTDGTNGFIIYAKDHGFIVGDVLTSEKPISCKLKLFNGSAELIDLNTSTEGLTVTSGGSVEAAEIAIGDLTGKNTGAVVSYYELTCSVDNGKYYLSDSEGNSLQVYNKLYDFGTLEEGEMYDITGVYLQYNNIKEIMPRSAADIEEIAIASEVLEVEIGESGYATLYCSDVDLAIPDDVTVTYVTGLNGKQLVTAELTEGIPAGTGVILQGDPGSYGFEAQAPVLPSIEGNMLFGTDEEGMIVDANSDDYYYYKLVEEDGVVGFWWGAEDGVPFENGANKAYLRVEKSYFESSSPAKVFYLFGGDGGVSTGINNVEKIAEGAAIYNLNGVRVNKMQKGVYVVNGKKVVIK